MPNQLESQDCDVDVVEEMQIDMRDVEMGRHVVAGEPDAGVRNVAAAEYAHRPRAVACAGSFAVEKALYVRQEGYELLVMALAEILRIAGELVCDLVPEARRSLVQQLPVALDLLPARMRDQLNRP